MLRGGHRGKIAVAVVVGRATCFCCAKSACIVTAATTTDLRRAPFQPTDASSLLRALHLRSSSAPRSHRSAPNALKSAKSDTTHAPRSAGHATRWRCGSGDSVGGSLKGRRLGRHRLTYSTEGECFVHLRRRLGRDRAEEPEDKCVIGLAMLPNLHPVTRTRSFLAAGPSTALAAEAVRCNRLRSSDPVRV